MKHNANYTSELLVITRNARNKQQNTETQNQGYQIPFKIICYTTNAISSIHSYESQDALFDIISF